MLGRTSDAFRPRLCPSRCRPIPCRCSSEWFREAAARRAQPNPDAMIVATTASNGDPSARVVLCKRIDVAAGYVVFFTNYESRKGRELAARPRAAAVLHWDALHRQVRIEGPVVRSPDSRERPVFREPRARQPDRRVGQRAKRAAGVAREPEATRARVRRTVRHRSRAHKRHSAAAAALGRSPSVDGHDRVVDGGRESRTRSRSLDALAAASRRIFVRGRPVAQHAPQSLTT